MTYAELRGTDAQTFLALAVQFRSLTGRLRDRAEAAGGMRTRLSDGWAGTAGGSALSGADRLCRQLVDTATLTSCCDRLLAELGARIERARALLAEAESMAASLGLAIGVDGRARPVPAAQVPVGSARPLPAGDWP